MSDDDPTNSPANSLAENPNRGIDGATWNTYRKTTATWAVKLPVDMTIRTSHGPVEAEAGDYLCVSADGELYPCSAETFEKQYERADPVGEDL